jgi:cohesin complex subunit SA-1/2
MQSARRPLQEIMDNNATSSPDPETARRRSGRVSTQPNRFAPDPSATKRKRDGADDDENDVPELDSEGSDDPDESSDDEPAPSRRRSAAKSKRAKKPANKKPKINGNGPEGGSRTMTLPRMPKKPTRLDVDGKSNQLYSMFAMHIMEGRF